MTVNLDWENLGFSYMKLPYRYIAYYRNGQWEEGTLTEELVDELHKRGYKVGLVSGGFHETVDRLAEQLGIDYVKANRLEIQQGFLTGQVLGEIVTKDTKLAMLKAWAAENMLELNQTIAMGDGANDLPMIQAAGIGIAFMAKPIVREQAPYQIQECNLYRVIDLLDNRKV